MAALVLADPASAQQRGTVAIGGFGSRTNFAPFLGINTGWGGGGRLGAFLSPSLAIEVEVGGSNSTRAPGLSDIGTWTQSARLTATPLTVGPLRLLVGAGVDHVDTHLNLSQSYGWHGLLGGTLALSDNLALRVDGVNGKMTSGQKTSGMRIGLSTFLSPRRLVTTQTRIVAGPTIIRPDSVSAMETARLRTVDANYSVLRDSLSRAVVTAPEPAPPEVEVTDPTPVMQEMIHFKTEESSLDDSAKAILREKVELFRTNPSMRIMITGFASAPGTQSYNMALGMRRAAAAKEFMVFLGVDASRIEIVSRGEGGLLVLGPGEVANAENRRSEFRLLIADEGQSTAKKQQS